VSCITQTTLRTLIIFALLAIKRGQTSTIFTLLISRTDYWLQFFYVSGTLHLFIKDLLNVLSIATYNKKIITLNSNFKINWRKI
jgi:hypothetical protein